MSENEDKLELYRDLPGYQKLTPEQRVVADRWDSEKIQRNRYYKILNDASKTKNNDLWRETLDNLQGEKCNAWMCEHGRHRSFSCMGCDAVEKILCPELYCKSEDCGFPLEEEEHEKGLEYCEYCREDK